MRYLYFIVPYFAFLYISCSPSSESNSSSDSKELTSPLWERAARAHGIEHWAQVEHLKFTFNVDKEGQQLLSRSYIWNPNTDSVDFQMNDQTIAYHRSQINDSITREADKAFINDLYWLIPTFKMVWDDNVSKVVNTGEGDFEHTITLSYGEEGGYTPGDKYKIYLDKDLMIKAWSYYASGQDSLTLHSSFEDYVQVEGLMFALNHEFTHKPLRVYFTNIDVKRK